MSDLDQIIAHITCLYKDGGKSHASIFETISKAGINFKIHNAIDEIQYRDGSREIKNLGDILDELEERGGDISVFRELTKKKGVKIKERALKALCDLLKQQTKPCVLTPENLAKIADLLDRDKPLRPVGPPPASPKTNATIMYLYSRKVAELKKQKIKNAKTRASDYILDLFHISEDRLTDIKKEYKEDIKKYINYFLMTL